MLDPLLKRIRSKQADGDKKGQGDEKADEAKQADGDKKGQCDKKAAKHLEAFTFSSRVYVTTN
jgi:hypothetical protein